MSRPSSPPGFPTNPLCRFVVAPAETRGLFVVTAGDRPGRVVSFVRQGLAISLGRSPDCTAHFDSASISRIHARAVWIADQFMISDAGSTNGTFVNGKSITSTVLLATGDQVRLGPELTMRFCIVDADEQGALILAGDAGVRDAVTGLVQRTYLENCIDVELIKAGRANLPLSVLMVAPEQCGDHASKESSTSSDLLAGLSWVLRSGVRAGDTLGYYGADTFVIVAPATELHDAHELADRLRRSVDAATFIQRSQPTKATVSIGVASIACCSLEVDRVSLLFLAEQRCWLAKRRRNAVVSTGCTIASSPPQTSREHVGAR